MKVILGRDVLETNDTAAEQNHTLLSRKGVTAVNVMSSPGAGKTTLIAETIRSLKRDLNIAVIEGDIQSTYDAEQISATGVPVVQINTGGACHLDAGMIHEALVQFDLDEVDLLIIENVGNLVCPAGFKLGEDHKVMLLSVPEGDDKPVKYPMMFFESSALLVNKIDLLPYLECSVSKIKTGAQKINPNLAIFEVSAKTGKGMDDWYRWLKEVVE